MRIGIDLHAAEQDGSGNATYIRNLVRGLLALDRDNTYILYILDPNHVFCRELRMFPNACLRPLGVRTPILRVPWALARATRRDRLDILHVQFVAPPFHRGRLTAAIHDLGFLHLPRTFSRFFNFRSRILVRLTARRAARVVTGSEFCRRDIARAYSIPPERIAVVPYGVEERFFEPGGPERGQAAAKKYGVGRPYLLSVGRLNPRKNLPALVRAFGRLKAETGIPHALVIAGKEDYDTARTVRDILAAGSRDVVLAGYVDEADLPALYAGAEVFLYPSLFEGVGLPVLEAMAAGVPIVASNTSAIPETAGEAALLVDPMDEKALAEAAGRLLRDRTLKNDLVRRGLARARMFTWRETARRMLEIFKSV